MSRSVGCGVAIAMGAMLLPRSGSAQPQVPTAPAIVQAADGRRFALTYRLGEDAITVALPDDDDYKWQPRVMPFPTGRIFIIGERSITVVEGTRVAKHLYAYWPSVSPDGRYVAFQKFYSRDTPEPLATAIYQVLDTDTHRELTVYPSEGGGRHGRLSSLQWVHDSILTLLDYDYGSEVARVVAIAVQDGAVVKSAHKVLDASRFVEPRSGPRPGLRFAEPEITRLPSEGGSLTLRLTFPTRPELKVRRMDIVLW